MRPWLPLALGCVLYMWQAWEYWRLGNSGLAFTFFGYTLANLGFIYSVMSQG